MVDTTGKEEGAAIIIKRVKKIQGGHHGGAWKVAYADFVTAMMAFFLLMWLLNVSTDEQKQAISSYFDPSNPRISETLSGAGGLMAGQSMAEQGAMVTNVQPINNPPVQPSRPLGGRSKDGDADDQAQDPGETEYDSQGFYDDGDPDAAEMNQEDWEDFQDGDFLKTPESVDEVDLTDATQEELERLEAELAEQLEEQRFEEARQEIEDALKENPNFVQMGQHVVMDMTPEGLRIQIVDQEGRSMFPIGQAELFDFAKDLVAVVAKVVEEMPNQLSIRGHTDGTPYPEGAKYTNWELSSDRANALRKALKTSGIPESRIENVVGRADKEHLLPDDPTAAQNRRISVVLLKENLTKKPEGMKETTPLNELVDGDIETTDTPTTDNLPPDIDETSAPEEPQADTPATPAAPSASAIENTETQPTVQEAESIVIEPVIDAAENNNDDDSGIVSDPMELPDVNPLDADDPFALPELESEIPNGGDGAAERQKILFF